MMLVVADLTISMAWTVLGTTALCAAALVILIALFGPGLRYTIAAPNSENPGSPEFAAAMEALTDSKLNGSVALTVLTNGPCFYEAELAAIASAKRSVCLEAYIFRKGEIANRYIAALTERARAGVEVNVLLDALGSFRITEHSFADFKRSGGKFAWYNPARWNRLPRYDNRTHRELLIVDGKIGFIGGAGIADQWYRGENGLPGWRDTMVKVVGPAVANLQATFAENWLEGCGNLLIGEAYFPIAREDPPDEAAVMVVSSSPTTGGSTRARILFQLLLASARKTIHINTPYFLPDASLSNELEKAIRERGVEVKVIVPGRKSDIWLTRTSSRRKYGPLLKAGVHIFEYQPAMIHAKVLMVDGLWGVVGSTNCDYRSFGLNDEVNLAASDQGFVQRLAEDFERDLANSREITYAEWSNRSIFERAPELLGWVVPTPAMKTMQRLRVATYNIHKCRGLDRRTSPERIAKVIRELQADIVALQEVLDVRDGKPEFDQARCLASELEGYHWSFGENRRLHGGAYGNMTLSRFPPTFFTNYDLTWRHRERRGCLRTDFEIGGHLLHIFNVHLGTSFVERRHQARRLVSPQVLTQLSSGRKIIMGDFNEWTRGLATRLMGSAFRVAEPKAHLGYGRTYPGVFPVMHLDHFYFDASLSLERMKVHRNRTALVASDHLPLVVDFLW